MKKIKWAGTILAVLMICAGMAACAAPAAQHENTPTETSLLTSEPADMPTVAPESAPVTTPEPAEEPDETVLGKLFAANDHDAILEEYKNFAIHYVDMDGDGETDSSMDIFFGKDNYSLVVNDYTIEDSAAEDSIVKRAFCGGEGYMLTDHGFLGEFIFAGDGLYEKNYADTIDEEMQYIYLYDAEDILSDEITADGKRVIRTTMTKDEEDETQIIENTYTVHPDSYLIESKTTVRKDGDGEVIGSQEAFWSYNVPESTLFNELKKQVKGSGGRSITVVNADSRQVYSTEVETGMSSWIIRPDGTILYSDEECTKEFDGEVDRNEDLTLYYKEII